MSEPANSISNDDAVGTAFPIGLPQPAREGSEPTLKQQVSSGLFWSGGARLAQQIVQFVMSVVLARLLLPRDYGIMAMAMVFTGFAGTLADLGFSPALVQKKEFCDADAHTVFWVSAASGILLAIVTTLLAPLLAAFYGEPTLRAIFPAISLNFVFGTAGSVPYALMQRRMEFREIGWSSTGPLLVSAVVGIALAADGAGVWALVAQTLTLSALTTVWRCISARWRPAFVFNASSLREMWRFSANLYGFNFINYWARNADNLLIGKYFGASPLGIYNRAYSLMLLPITQINSVLSQVAFPAFASLQSNKQRVGQLYCRGLAMVTLIAFPLMTGLACLAQPFVVTIYGQKWEPVAPLLQILALVSLIQVVVNSTGWLFISQGRTDLMLRWGVIYSIAVIASFAIGISLGSIKTVALCYGAVNILFFFPWMAAAASTVGISAAKIVKSIAGPAVASAVMGASITALQFLLPQRIAPVVMLVALSIAGALIYTISILPLRLEAVREISAYVLHRRGDRG